MFRTHTTGRSNQMRAAGVGTATRSQLQTQTFLQDAFNQLDEVLKRKRALATAEEDGADKAQFSAAEIKASQQMIQRWLVIFAREHLPDICEKLMACAEEQRRVAEQREEPQHREGGRLPHALRRVPRSGALV